MRSGDRERLAALYRRQPRRLRSAPGAARLLIAADRDAAGRRAAARLKARAMEQGLAAVVLVPAHGDFNDDLAALGPRALAARLAPLLGPGAGTGP